MIVYHGDYQGTPQGQGNLEGRLLEHFQQSPGVPFEVAELAAHFCSSQSHMRRLVKRLWRQGHITEEMREVEANNGRGGKSRKKVFVSPELGDQMTKSQSGHGAVSLDQDLPESDHMIKTTVYQGSLSGDHPSWETGDLQHEGLDLCSESENELQNLSDHGPVSSDHSNQHPRDLYICSPDKNSPPPELKQGDWVELLTGYFTGRQVQVVGFPRKKPGWVEVKGKAWLITKEYQRQDVRLIRRANA